MLGSLLKSVLLESCLSLHESLVGVFKLTSRAVDFLDKHSVLLLEPLIVVSLLWIKVIKLCFVGVTDLLDLLFVGLNLIFHISFLGEKIVKMRFLLVILVFDVHKKGLDVLWLGVTSILVQSQVVISKFSLKLSHILDQGLVPSFESEIRRVILVDLLDLRLHLIDFIDNIVVLVFEQVEVVRPVVNLSARAYAAALHAGHSCVSHWSFHCGYFRVVADT